MNKPLTASDRKLLYAEKRVGFVFTWLIISFGGLFNVINLSLNFFQISVLEYAIIDIAILATAIFIGMTINGKVNRDLKEGVKQVLKMKLESKKKDIIYEAGSGSLYIPGLGDLFPSLWGQKMREIPVLYFVNNNRNYEVTKEIYDKLQVGDDFYLHLAKNCYLNLGVSIDV